MTFTYISKLRKICSPYFENFVTLLKEVITELTGRSHFEFSFVTEFKLSASQETTVCLNILVDPTPYNYTCGIGQNIYRVKSMREHNIALGSPCL